MQNSGDLILIFFVRRNFKLQEWAFAQEQPRLASWSRIIGHHNEQLQAENDDLTPRLRVVMEIIFPARLHEAFMMLDNGLCESVESLIKREVASCKFAAGKELWMNPIAVWRKKFIAQSQHFIYLIQSHSIDVTGKIVFGDPTREFAWKSLQNIAQV